MLSYRKDMSPVSNNCWSSFRVQDASRIPYEPKTSVGLQLSGIQIEKAVNEG